MTFTSLVPFSPRALEKNLPPLALRPFVYGWASGTQFNLLAYLLMGDFPGMAAQWEILMHLVQIFNRR